MIRRGCSLFTQPTILWNVDPLLGNDRKTNNKAKVRKQQQRNGVFFAARAEIL
jgi:hypothetical protein